MTTASQVSSAIFHAHQDLLIADNVIAKPPTFFSEDPIYQAAKIACYRLGFIEKDAECLAKAWVKMVSTESVINPSRWPDEINYFDMPSWPRENSFTACPKNLGLYVVAPNAEWIKRLVELKVPTIQLRFKSNNLVEIESEVIQAIEACQNSSSHLYINDHWSLAIKHRAYGVHLGQEDLDSADLELIKNAGLRLGISTHGYAEMIRADQFSPSYIALGAIFPTTLKKMETSPQGLGRLSAYSQLLRHYPLVGIGGVDQSNLSSVLKSGVGSAAVVRAVINSDNPMMAVEELKNQFSSYQIIS
jgi:thiamine-phosphate pyrophosphorylase